MSARALDNWTRLEAQDFFHALVDRGKIVRTQRVDAAQFGAAATQWAGVLEHARVPFVSYAYEWPFGMLRDAALLHLELLRAALDAGMTLKDSSAYNVQWDGARPVFIDIPSFEPLGRGEPWIGYRQFCELFLYPLMLQAYKGLDFRPWLRGRIDGISAEAMRAVLSARDLLRPGVLMHVAAQASLQRRYSGKPDNVRGALAQAGFDKRLIVRNVETLARLIGRLEPAVRKTQWSDYDHTHSYGSEDFKAKAAFVRAAAATRKWQSVWDLGCNTGTFARIVAEHADHVVAMDGDWMAVEHLYRRLKQPGAPTNILPLAVDLADPSPNQGWLGLERKSLHVRGRPDLTLALALVHHMAIGANIPMRDVVGWLAGLDTALVVEFVGREDEMVQTLLRNKDDQYDDYTRETFEALLGRHFEIASRQMLKGGKREIYFALPKRAA